MEWFKAFNIYINLENQFWIFVFEKSVLFNLPKLCGLGKKLYIIESLFKTCGQSLKIIGP